MKKKPLFFLGLLLVFGGVFVVFNSTKKSYSPEEKQYISTIEKERSEKDLEMKNSPESPFNAKGKVHFENLKYFDPDPSFVFKCRLFEYPPGDTITIYGTKGEPRKAVKYGYVVINYKNKDYKLNVYKGFARTGLEYYAIWFTDQTTDKETYGVGRYLDFEKNDNKDYLYTIDFNKAYNPYCAYSPNYSCAIPTKEDYIDLAIKAGEKKFHD